MESDYYYVKGEYAQWRGQGSVKPPQRNTVGSTPTSPILINIDKDSKGSI